MSLKRFMKLFGIALALQLFFVFGGYSLLFGPSGAKEFRNSVLLLIYAPFIDWVIRVGAYTGESSMIWPPVYGLLIGTLIYSGLFSLIVTLLTRKRIKAP